MKLHVLVKNFQGVNDDIDVFEYERDAKKAFYKYTGFKWNKEYTDPASSRYQEDFSETKIFEVSLRQGVGDCKR